MIITVSNEPNNFAARVPVEYVGRAGRESFEVRSRYALDELGALYVSATPVGPLGDRHGTEYYHTTRTRHVEGNCYALDVVRIPVDSMGAPVPVKLPAPTHTPLFGIRIMSRAERDAYKANRSNRFGSRNRLWGKHRMGAPGKVGALMPLIAEIDPATDAEWLEGYTTHKGGRSWQALERLANMWAAHADLTPSAALAEVMIHVLDETYDGHERENKVMAELERTTYGAGKLFRPGYRWDIGYGIDCALRDDDSEHGFTVGIQIKPGSYFERGDLDHRLELLDKMDKARAHGVVVLMVNADEVLAGHKHTYTTEETRRILRKQSRLKSQQTDTTHNQGAAA